MASTSQENGSINGANNTPPPAPIPAAGGENRQEEDMEEDEEGLVLEEAGEETWHVAHDLIPGCVHMSINMGRITTSHFEVTGMGRIRLVGRVQNPANPKEMMHWVWKAPKITFVNLMSYPVEDRYEAITGIVEDQLECMAKGDLRRAREVGAIKAQHAAQMAAIPGMIQAANQVMRLFQDVFGELCEATAEFKVSAVVAKFTAAVTNVEGRLAGTGVSLEDCLRPFMLLTMCPPCVREALMLDELKPVHNLDKLVEKMTADAANLETMAANARAVALTQKTRQQGQGEGDGVSRKRPALGYGAGGVGSGGKPQQGGQQGGGKGAGGSGAAGPGTPNPKLNAVGGPKGGKRTFTGAPFPQATQAGANGVDARGNPKQCDLCGDVNHLRVGCGHYPAFLAAETKRVNGAGGSKQ
mmetsp:Transcript_33483/g.84843  ORF Transcript_33483/g.84843 Transcript_33483/m.84843 type:complete len:413 (-) Transcript_33483:201-1439(-)